MNIVIIGTGNVAHVLGSLLANAGHRIVQVYGRTAANAAALATLLSAEACSGWQQINHDADLYLIAVADKALYEIKDHLCLPGRIVVHTAGSVPVEVLAGISENHGVFYPLQSLKRALPVITEIPLLIDASNELTRNALLMLAREISPQVSLATNHERLEYHVAAVFVNNFTNHLYALAGQFCRDQELDFHLLLPLARETADRLALVPASQSMTGPAIRNDQGTIAKHLALLKNHTAARDLYQALTDSIQQFQKEQKEHNPS